MRLQGIFRENRDVFKIVGILLSEILLCRLTGGYALILLVLYAINCMAKHKTGGVILSYIFLSFLINLNGTIMGGVNSVVFRGSFLAITVMVIVQSSSRGGRNKVPLGFLYLYLVVALASSIDGWCPPISYLKLLNFFLFLVGLHIGTKNLDRYPEQIELIRKGLLAFAVLLIGGSIAVIPFPSIGYSMMISQASRWMDVTDVATFVEQAAVPMYSGLTNHSQSLAPFTVGMGTWVLCDMLMVERRLNPLHVLLLCGCPILLYMTRSRVGLVSMTASLSLIYFYTLSKLKISAKIKSKLRSTFTGGLVLLAVGAMVMEARDHSITKWLRKTADIETDTRNIADAMTASRQGAVEENLYYFHKRPMLGTGFQVSEMQQTMYQSGQISIFTAPIEKGLLPLMILGETGAVGATVFSLFLLTFVGVCVRKKYYATLSLFVVLLVTNIGEATFFAPTAVGGSLWIVAVAGGFAIDMQCLVDRRKDLIRMSGNGFLPFG